jgi:hypothetical protein
MSTPYRLRAARPADAGGPSSCSDVLGPAVRSYHAAAHHHVIWAASPFVLLLAYGLWLAHKGLLAHWFNSTFSVGAVAALFVLSVALIGHTAAVGGGELVRVHAGGLLDLRAGPRAVRWDEIRSLTAVLRADGRVDHHMLCTADGAMLTLGDSIGAVDQLVDEVRVRMIEHRGPALQARLSEGGAVRFGAIEARGDGLVLEGRRLPWAEVGDVDVEGQDLVVRTRSNERWAAVPLDHVPNAFLLADLIERHARR